MLDAAPSLITTVSGVQHQHGSVMRLHVFSWSTVNSDPTFTLRKVVDFFSVLEADNIFEGHTNALYCSLVSANSKMFVKA